jgi:hypothetical protein
MAKVIDRGSQIVGKDELNIFKLPATQIATERSMFLSVYPKNGIAETNISSPITFEISGVPDYLDLKKNFLKIKFQIRKDDGAVITNTDNVAPINYISNTFIQQMKIFLNNKLISESSDTYIYRSYIETLINYSNDVKDTHLQLGGWYQDAICASQTTIDKANNTCFIKRKNLAQGSITFEVLAPLHSDIFNQTNYMLPNVYLRVELFRNPHSRVLMKFDADANAPVNYNLHIKSIEWNVRVVEVIKSLSLSNEKKLLRDTAKYQLSRTVVKTHPLSSQTQDVRNMEIYNGQLPSGLLIGFIVSSAFHGDSSLSPFNFQPFDLETAQAIVGGRRWPVERPLETDFGNNLITEAYFQFLNNSGFLNSFQDSNGISLEMYKGHCFFLAFDFRSDEKDDDSAVDFIKYGETRLFLRFRIPLQQPTHLIAYLSFDNILRIDAGRNAIMDYTL